MEIIKKVRILKVSDSRYEEMSDAVVVEKPINIFVNFEFYAALMCTPDELEELAAGFLFSEGVVSSRRDIESIEMKYGDRVCVVLSREFKRDDGRIRARSTGCGNGSVHLNELEDMRFKPVESEAEFSAESILSIMREFNSRSETFRETGGVHSCALCGEDGVELFSEDIGRHNALDKVIGRAVLQDISLGGKFILTSGRLSSDIVLKAAAAGVPMIVSHSAPTDLAIEIAEASNISLLGFVRGNRMNVYCCSQRILQLHPEM